jgi:type VI secretion system secreted protein Hcp
MANTDVFLLIETRRAGKIKGRATDKGVEEQIPILGWSMGLSSPGFMGGTVASARRTYSPLTIAKSVDSSTTALMAALATNDVVKRAVLTFRKAGGEQIDFLKVTLERARIVSVDLDLSDGNDIAENISIAFEKIEIEYSDKDQKGMKGGASVFSDELLPA